MYFRGMTCAGPSRPARLWHHRRVPLDTELPERRTAIDVVLVLVLVALGVEWGAAALDLGGPLRAALGVAAPLGVVLGVGTRRRRDPLPAVVALAVSSVVVSWASGAGAWAVLGPSAVFLAGAHEARPRVRQAVTIAGSAALAVAAALTARDWLSWALDMVALAAVVGWARGIRVRRLYQEGLRRRAEDAERERDLRAAQAVAEERARIARDIHDIVSHSLAVVAVQAGGAQRIAERDPERAKEALGVIADTARGALAEMRALLQVLRSGDPSDAPGSPSPGLAEIDSLASGLAARGVPVDLQVTGTPFRLGAGAELAVHRVAQESLTNAVKHGGGGPVRLRLDYQPDALLVTVANPLPTGERQLVPGSGSGLAGMRERLALYGGSLAAGPVGDRFEVRARIPRTEPPTPATPATTPAPGAAGHAEARAADEGEPS